LRLPLLYASITLDVVCTSIWEIPIKMKSLSHVKFQNHSLRTLDKVNWCPYGTLFYCFCYSEGGHPNNSWKPEGRTMANSTLQEVAVRLFSLDIEKSEVLWQKEKKRRVSSLVLAICLTLKQSTPLQVRYQWDQWYSQNQWNAILCWQFSHTWSCTSVGGKLLENALSFVSALAVLL